MQILPVKSPTLFIVACSCALFSGCGGGKPFDSVPVAGIVTLDGQPVEGATVIFNPGEGGKPATANTDGAGKFTLTTHNPGDGAMPGTYKVAISRTTGIQEEDLSGLSPEEAAIKGRLAAEEQMRKYPGGEVPRKDLLPAKYKDPETSGFTLEVKRDEENNFELNLGKRG